MILIFIGIAAWLLISVALGLAFARAFALEEGSDSREPKDARSPQLQLVTPDFEREHAA
jgi:hypothetical protein